MGETTSLSHTDELSYTQEPMTTSNSASAVIIPKDGKYVAIFAPNWRKGYNFPAGKQDPGETPEQTAIRETFEETGLTICNLVYLGQRSIKEFVVHAFYANVALGSMKSSEEGEVLLVSEEDIIINSEFSEWNAWAFQQAREKGLVK